VIRPVEPITAPTALDRLHAALDGTDAGEVADAIERLAEAEPDPRAMARVAAEVRGREPQRR
jgi:hypothetical protein